MTTLAEARAELAQIAERQAALQKIVDAAPKSLLVPGDEYCISNWQQYDEVADVIAAMAYADALDTLLMLRHQPGSEAVSDDCRSQFCVCIRDYSIGTDVWCATRAKIERISPCFATAEDAQAAIDTIGADRILRMFRTLHGVA